MLRCCTQDVTAQVLLQLVGRTQANRSAQQAAAEIEAVRQRTRSEEAAAEALRAKAAQIEVCTLLYPAADVDLGFACPNVAYQTHKQALSGAHYLYLAMHHI